MAYLEFEIPARSWSSIEKEILYAHMSQIGFEGFVEGEDDIQAYIEEQRFSSEAWNLLIDELASLNIKLQYRYHVTEDQNWNEEWEKKFSPVEVDSGGADQGSFS
jgi:ribosomal protein L11 methyltransferase